MNGRMLVIHTSPNRNNEFIIDEEFQIDLCYIIFATSFYLIKLSSNTLGYRSLDGCVLIIIFRLLDYDTQYYAF